ncbi:endo-1,6-beta-D-glucanase BGN16.3 [Trichoderma chlorosporum]
MRASLIASLAASVAASEHAAVSPRQAGAQAYASNGANYQLTPIAAPVQGNGSPGPSTWNLSIDDSSSGFKQQITGFGAAVTDATVAVFNQLSASTLSQLLNELVTSGGAGFSLMRHTIGASDLSANPAYTYDDNGGNADPNFNGFNLGDRGTAMAEMLAQMQSLNGNLKILGSPWSPPAWMKLNHVIDGNTTNNNLNDGYLTNNGAQDSASFATYFVKYIQAYKSHGATIDFLTLQNEPLNSQSGYPTMYMFSYEQGDLIQNYVAPALKNAGLGTQIWAYDHNTDVIDYPTQVIGVAGSDVAGVAWHCYASPAPDWTVLSTFHNNFPNVPQYMTECYTPQGAAWNDVVGFTMGPLQNWASGVLAWTLGSDASNGPHLTSGGCGNCQGLVTVNNGQYTLQTSFYMLAQFSKFMPVGAHVLNGSGSAQLGPGGVESVATLNPDGTRTVVIENTYSNDIYIHLSTSSGQEWSGNIPTNSLVTWVLPAV